MKALVVTSDHTLILKEISLPKPGPFEALVKIMACGFCSTTDFELIRGTQPNHNDYPCVLGHEAIGEVIEVGRSVTNLRLGDWVTRPSGITPGNACDGISSAWGGFAEYGLVTDYQALLDAGHQFVPEDYFSIRQNKLANGPAVGLEASVLSIPLAETFDWLRQLNLFNSTVCIGGTGIAGLSLIIWSKLAGAKKVIVLGRRKERLDLAKELGADHVVNFGEHRLIDAVHELSGGGVDFFLEATGAPEQLETAIRSVRKGGVTAVFGVAPNGQYALNWNWLPVDIRITKHDPQEHLARTQVLKFIEEGRVPIGKLMTHTWPLEQFQIGVDAVQAGKVVKCMLTMS